MITINQGLISSFIVLQFLQNDEKLNRECRIHVECFQNCREHGLTFSMYSYNDDEGKGQYIRDKETFCVYEHRNSDSIIVNGKTNWTSFSGDLPFRQDSKFRYDAEFKADEHYQCYLFLKQKFLEIRQNAIDKKKVENANQTRTN